MESIFKGNDLEEAQIILWFIRAFVMKQSVWPRSKKELFVLMSRLGVSHQAVNCLKDEIEKIKKIYPDCMWGYRCGEKHYWCDQGLEDNSSNYCFLGLCVNET